MAGRLRHAVDQAIEHQISHMTQMLETLGTECPYQPPLSAIVNMRREIVHHLGLTVSDELPQDMLQGQLLKELVEQAEDPETAVP